MNNFIKLMISLCISLQGFAAANDLGNPLGLLKEAANRQPATGPSGGCMENQTIETGEQKLVRRTREAVALAIVYSNGFGLIATAAQYSLEERLASIRGGRRKVLPKDLDQMSEELAGRITAQNAQLADQASALDELRARLSEQEAEAAARIADLTAALSQQREIPATEEKETQAGDASAALPQIAAQDDRTAAEIEYARQCREIMPSIQALVHAETAAKEDLERRLETTNASLRQKEEELERLNATIREWEVERSEIDRQIASVETQIASLTEVAEKEERARSALMETTDLVDERDGQIESLRAELKVLELSKASLHARDIELENVRRELTSAQTKIEDLTRRVPPPMPRHLPASLPLVTSESAGAEARLALEKSLDFTRGELQAARGNIRLLESSIENLLREIAELKYQNAELVAREVGAASALKISREQYALNIALALAQSTDLDAALAEERRARAAAQARVVSLEAGLETRAAEVALANRANEELEARLAASEAALDEQSRAFESAQARVASDTGGAAPAPVVSQKTARNKPHRGAPQHAGNTRYGRHPLVGASAPAAAPARAGQAQPEDRRQAPVERSAESSVFGAGFHSLRFPGPNDLTMGRDLPVEGAPMPQPPAASQETITAVDTRSRNPLLSIFGKPRKDSSVEAIQGDGVLSALSRLFGRSKSPLTESSQVNNAALHMPLLADDSSTTRGGVDASMLAGSINGSAAEATSMNGPSTGPRGAQTRRVPAPIGAFLYPFS